MLDLRAKHTRITLYYPDGTSALDVSAVLDSIAPANKALDEGGICSTTATLKLFAYPQASFSESLNPLTNANRFKRGCRVLIEQDFGSGYEVHPRGRLRILKAPRPPSPKNPYLEIQLGCLLAFNDWRQAPANNLNVRGTNLNTLNADYENYIKNLYAINLDGTLSYQNAINRLAAKAKLPTLTDTITTPYSIDFDFPRLSGGYVTQMGQLAYAVDHVLWIDNQEHLRATKIDLAASPFASLTVGADEESFDFEEPEETPSEYVRVYWSKPKLQPLTDPDPVTSTSKNSQYDPVERTKVQIVGMISSTPLTLRFVDKPLGILFPDKFPNDGNLWTAENGEEYSYYGAGGILESKVGKTFQPRGSVLPDLFPDDTFVIESKRTETYYYYTGSVTNEIAIYNYEPFAKVFPSKVTDITIGSSELTLSTYEITRWQKTGKGYVKTVSSTSLIEGDTSSGTSVSYSDTQNQPPAAEYKQSPPITKDTAIEGEARFPLYKSQFTDRVRSYEVPAITSKDHATHVAELLGKILHGRNFRCTFTAELSAAWRSSYSPLRLIDWVFRDYQSGGWIKARYLVDAESFALTSTETAVSAQGILVGTIARYRTDGGTPAPLNQPANPGDVEFTNTDTVYSVAIVLEN